MPRTFDCKVIQTYSDDEGRMLSIDIEVGASKLSLIAVYSPTQGHVEEQVKFFHLLQYRLSHISVNANQSIVLCGDFNAHLSRLDSDSNRFRRNTASRLLESILAEYSLKDVWRIHHPHTRQYTWRRLNPVQQSRIDYVFASKHLVSNNVVVKSEIEPGILSDHSIVNLEMRIYSNEKGPGLWRFNNTLLKNEEFVNSVRDEISKAIAGTEIYAATSNKGLMIEMLSSQIRVIGIKISKRLARKAREEEEDDYETYKILKMNWQVIQLMRLFQNIRQLK